MKEPKTELSPQELVKLKAAIDIEDAQSLFRFLIGGAPPKGITLGKRPRKMTPEQAFAVIYVLQEGFHLIPDHFDLCSYCGWLYDSEREGHSPETGSKMFCDGCSQHCRCKECRRPTYGRARNRTRTGVIK